MKFALLVVLLCSLALAACQRPTPTVSREHILTRLPSNGREVVRHGGSDGPYKITGGFGIIGDPDQGISSTWVENGKTITVDQAAEPGYTFQLNRYPDKAGRFFWVLLKKNNASSGA
jgi:hypothetical protein